MLHPMNISAVRWAGTRSPPGAVTALETKLHYIHISNGYTGNFIRRYIDTRSDVE